MVRLLRRMGARAVQPVAASRPAPNTSCAFGKSDREEPTALKRTARPPRTPLQYVLRIRQDGSVVPGHPAPLGHQMEREINHAATREAGVAASLTARGLPTALYDYRDETAVQNWRDL